MKKPTTKRTADPRIATKAEFTAASKEENAFTKEALEKTITDVADKNGTAGSRPTRAVQPEPAVETKTVRTAKDTAAAPPASREPPVTPGKAVQTGDRHQDPKPQLDGDVVLEGKRLVIRKGDVEIAARATGDKAEDARTADELRKQMAKATK